MRDARRVRIACGELSLLLLLLKTLGMLMNDRWWRVGCGCFGSKVDCRSVDIEANLEVEA